MDNIDHILDVECTRLGLEKSYVQALIHVESAGQQWATRYEPGFSDFEKPAFWAGKLGQSLDTEMAGQKTSWGLMQILGGTARWLGFSGYCPELCVSSVGLHYGCLLLAKKLLKYGTYEDAIAAYNAGNVRKINTKYENQTYVDRVLTARQEFI